jgi:hypothetical protein
LYVFEFLPAYTAEFAQHFMQAFGGPILRPMHLAACGKRGLFCCIFGLDGREGYRDCGWSRYTALTV